MVVVLRSLGWTSDFNPADARRLLQIGGDLFLRTGLLTLFLLLATRVATQAGAQAGAAHQAIRQFWLFAALGLDALAITAQTLVGFFTGAHLTAQARRVALYSCAWGLFLGGLLGRGMWFGREAIAALLVPAEASTVFIIPWLVAAAVQPLNALAFVTDGIHWGTGDFAYLRNAVALATPGRQRRPVADRSRGTRRAALGLAGDGRVDHHSRRLRRAACLARHWPGAVACASARMID